MSISLNTIVKQGSAEGSRYTVTRPLTALVAICLPSAIGAFAVGAPLWIGTSFTIAGLLVLLVHLCTYIYCVVNDRDAIRKEHFAIRQPEIEKSLIAHDISKLSNLETALLDEPLTNPISGTKLLEPTE
jgi:hypothetical protein